MQVAQIGNFEPPHSTENELLDALGRLPGVEVWAIQENDHEAWERLLGRISRREVDMVLWTSTRSLNAKIPEMLQRRMLNAAAADSIPTVGYHLDRWWGLHANKRQEQMWEPDGSLLPFFGVQTLFTADGGHQEQWAEIGVNHIWMPPAVSERWCYLAEPSKRYECDIVFVGGWEHYGHTEWTHRPEMIAKVREWYGDRFVCLPKSGQPRITMGDLNTVYASAKVVLGDSCLVPKADGSPMTHYCSDRIPETQGRGGVLLHPLVEGITDLYKHYWWQLGDWDQLHYMLDDVMALEDWPSIEQRQVRVDSTLAEHTYTHRMREVLELTTGWTP